MISSDPGARKSFRALSAGAACNSFGFFGEQVIVGYVVFELTGASRWVGVALALYFAPMFIFGLASGALTDWTQDRTRMLRNTELGIAASLACFALVVQLGGASLPVMLALSAITGTGLALHQTLRGTLAFDLAGPERIVRALGRLNLVARLGQLAGAAAAGWLVRKAGLDAGLALLGAVHLAGALAYLGLSTVPSPDASRIGLRENLCEFAKEFRTNRGLTLLVVITAAVEVLGFSFVTALPELATVRFGVDAEGLGTLHSARALGGILAALIFATAIRIEARGSLYVAVVAAFSAAIFALSLAPTFWFGFAALAGIAALAVATDVLSQSMIQFSVSDHMRGRAMGAWVFAIGAAPLGHLELGLLVDALGVANALIVNACLLAALSLAALGTIGRLRGRRENTS